MRYAEVKISSVYVDVYKLYECDDSNEIYKVLSTLENKKLKLNIILIEKYKNLLENSDFEQNYWSRTSQGNYIIGHDSIRLMKRIC